MNTVKSFTNDTLGTVRVVKKADIEWFVAKDICDILEIGNSTQALTRLDDDEKSALIINEVASKNNLNHEINVVNEYGLWQLVLTSRKPQAKAFKRWLTHEVIPAIRSNGGYIDGQEFLPAEEKARLDAEIQELSKMVWDYKYQNSQLQDKVDHLAHIIERDTTGDFDKRQQDSWSESELYDLDVEGYDKFQSDMEIFNFADFELKEELIAIIKSAKPNYVDKSAEKYLINEINRLFADRNVR